MKYVIWEHPESEHSEWLQLAGEECTANERRLAEQYHTYNVQMQNVHGLARNLRAQGCEVIILKVSVQEMKEALRDYKLPNTGEGRAKAIQILGEKI